MKELYVAGLGPGKAEYMTGQAREALEKSDVILGYTVYVDLVRPLFPDKEFVSTGMTKEIDRCRKALELAESGKTVSLICSGDAGVYGMASPVLELAEEYPDVDIHVVAGVTAATSGAAVLGAPLATDFCVISLSTRLTPWETIATRLEAAAFGDFPVVLYNPASKSRTEEIHKARQVFLACGKSPQTVCGLVRNIGRDGEDMTLCTLDTLCEHPINMFTTVFIGASNTKETAGRMVTPRGYENSKTQSEAFLNSSENPSEPEAEPAARMPKKILLFGGTSEARELADKLAARGDEVTVSVATEYGEELQSENPDVTVRQGRLTEEEMEALLPDYDLCVDATHPYALEVTENTRYACKKTRTPYVRVARHIHFRYSKATVLTASDAEMAAQWCGAESGNILLTTGIKELPAFSNVPRNRLFPRVLPSEENLKALGDAGIPKKNIIAMQGPFSKELNIALIRQFDIETVVTKNSGKRGGFPEKVEAAGETGARVIVITPPEEDGLSVEEFLEQY